MESTTDKMKQRIKSAINVVKNKLHIVIKWGLFLGFKVVHICKSINMIHHKTKGRIEFIRSY